MGTPWVSSFSKKYPDTTPNIARKNDRGHYEIGNIELVSQEQNRNDQNIPQTWEHGTLSGYRYCKCDLCKQANNAFMREWRAKKKGG